jgi:hypothetical protein
MAFRMNCRVLRFRSPSVDAYITPLAIHIRDRIGRFSSVLSQNWRATIRDSDVGRLSENAALRKQRFNLKAPGQRRPGPQVHSEEVSSLASVA